MDLAVMYRYKSMHPSFAATVHNFRLVTFVQINLRYIMLKWFYTILSRKFPFLPRPDILHLGRLRLLRFDSPGRTSSLCACLPLSPLPALSPCFFSGFQSVRWGIASSFFFRVPLRLVLEEGWIPSRQQAQE